MLVNLQALVARVAAPGGRLVPMRSRSGGSVVNPAPEFVTEVGGFNLSSRNLDAQFIDGLSLNTVSQVSHARLLTQQTIAALDVTADPLKPTAASQAEALPRDELYPMTGYADATLMKDMRFKIGHALRNAGLHGTAYARELLSDQTRFGPTKPHMVSNVPFGPAVT